MARPGRGDKGVYDTTHNVLANLDLYCKQKRERDGLSLREAAEQAGVAHTMLHRLERGGTIRIDTAMAVLDWLAAS